MIKKDKQVLIIRGRLAGRNEAEAAARTHWSKGAELKRINTEIVMWEAVSKHIQPIKGRACVTIEFFEQSLKRDEDNVVSSFKYILDGLVAAKVIHNDNRNCVDLHILPVKLDRNNPRIEVTLAQAAEL